MNEIQGTVQSIAFGGEGIIKCDNKVIFVPFVAPHETIKAIIKQDKKSFAKAKLSSIIDPSNSRTTPPCAYFTNCGGCQLQHIYYSEQLNIKRLFVKDALMRIGKINVEVKETIASKTQLFYRKHIKLQVQNSQIGFIRHDLNGIIPINKCAIFDHESSSIIESLSSLSHLFKNIDEIHIYQENDNYVIYLVSSKKLVKDLGNVIMQKITCVKGVLSNHQQWGDCNLHTIISGIKLIYNPLVFMQANEELSQNIMHRLLELINTYNCKNIIDLYCGIGVSSLLLKKAGCNIIAIELNPHAIDAAKQNAALNNLNDISWHTMDATKLDTLDIKSFNADSIIINPPRTGISKALINILIKLKVKNIFYISCMPSTLARDIKELNTYYDVGYCQPFDMFPQTTHVETLLHLQLK